MNCIHWKKIEDTKFMINHYGGKIVTNECMSIIARFSRHQELQIIANKKLIPNVNHVNPLDGRSLLMDVCWSDDGYTANQPTCDNYKTFILLMSLKGIDATIMNHQGYEYMFNT